MEGANTSPHLGLHHAEPLLPQLLHTVKHIHFPLSLPHLQEEVQGDEGTCAPDPCTEDTKISGSGLALVGMAQHPNTPSPIPAVHQHRSSRCFQHPLVHHLHQAQELGWVSGHSVVWPQQVMKLLHCSWESTACLQKGRHGWQQGAGSVQETCVK